MSYLARWLLVVTLGFTSGSKLLGADQTTVGWQSAGFIPPALGRPLAFAVPGVEIATAALLVHSRTAPFGAALALFLSLVFSGLHAYVVAYGEVVPCGCIGALAISHATRSTHIAMLALAAAMLGASATVMIAGIRRNQV